MSQTLINAKATMLLYRMQIAWFILFTGTALGTASLTALTGMDWAASNPQTKLMVTIGVFVSWGNTMMALFNKSMNRIEEGKLPFADQTVITDTSAHIEQHTVATPPMTSEHTPEPEPSPAPPETQ